MESISLQSHIKYIIQNPLDVLLGVGDYDKGVMPSLIGVPQDYINMIYAFHHVLGYCVTFRSKQDKKSNNNCNNGDKYKYFTNKNKIISLRTRMSSKYQNTLVG